MVRSLSTIIFWCFTGQIVSAEVGISRRRRSRRSSGPWEDATTGAVSRSMATAFGDRCIDQMPGRALPPSMPSWSCPAAPRSCAGTRRWGPLRATVVGGHLAAWNARRPSSVALPQQILPVFYREFDLFRPDGTSLGVIHYPSRSTDAVGVFESEVEHPATACAVPPTSTTPRVCILS